MKCFTAFDASADMSVEGSFLVGDWPTEEDAQPHGAFGYIFGEAKPGVTPVSDGATFTLEWQVECIQEKRWNNPTEPLGRSRTLQITGA
jgi:hypothetical protein